MRSSGTGRRKVPCAKPGKEPQVVVDVSGSGGSSPHHRWPVKILSAGLETGGQPKV